jgi:hypothetical protein
MLKTARNDLYKKAAMKWGSDAQKVVALKELADLSKRVAGSINRKPQNEGFLQSLADAYIMIEQLALMAGRSEFEKTLLERLTRLKEAVEE